jgi:hypothetical protein
MDPTSRIGEFCDVERLYKLGRFVLSGKGVSLRHYRNLWRMLCLQSWIDGELFQVEGQDRQSGIISVIWPILLL